MSNAANLLYWPEPSDRFDTAFGPSVAVAGFSGALAEEIMQDIALCGGHAAWQGSLGWFDARAAEADIVILNACTTGVLDHAVLEQCHPGARVLVITKMDMLDIVYAQTVALDLYIVIGGNRAERLAAMCSLMGADSKRVRETAGDIGGEDLRRLADAVAVLSDQIARFADVGPGFAAGGIWPSAVADPAIPFRDAGSDLETGLTRHSGAKISAVTVRSILKARRLRSRFFDDGLFADPAWDMLLDLTAARLEGEAVSVSSLCIAAHVPPTTALRWIKLMTNAGLFVRRSDRGDGRRAFIAISDTAFRAMQDYICAAYPGGHLPL